MRKMLLLLLLIPFGVSASEEAKYQENILSGETVTMYKYYKIEKEFGPYELETTSNEVYPLVDYGNYIYTDYSDWTTEKLDKDYIEKTFYKYSTVADTNQIIIGKFNHNYYYVDVTDVQVFYADEEIPFSVECTLCETNFEEKLKLGKARVNTNGTITLTLDKEYETEKLDIEINFIAISGYVTGISFEYRNNDLQNSYDYYYDVNSYGTIKADGNTITLKNSEKIIYKEEKDNGTLIGEEVFYKYRDKLYLKYRENKTYTDYLLENPDPLIYFKDENDFKMYYKEISIPEEETAKAVVVISTETISNPIRLSANEIAEKKQKTLELNETTETLNTEKAEENPLKVKQDTEKDNSYLYLFLIIPILFLIKIILLLSKLYKDKKKNDNL